LNGSVDSVEIQTTLTKEVNELLNDCISEMDKYFQNTHKYSDTKIDWVNIDCLDMNYVENTAMFKGRGIQQLRSLLHSYRNAPENTHPPFNVEVLISQYPSFVKYASEVGRQVKTTSIFGVTFNLVNSFLNYSKCGGQNVWNVCC